MPSYFVERADCSRHTIFPGVEIFTTFGKSMLFSLVELQPRSVVEPHSHPHEQMGMLLEGNLRFTIGGQTQDLGPGDLWRIPGGVEHTCVAGPEGAKAIDVFSPVREEYK